jgi:hypothetical protein
MIGKNGRNYVIEKYKNAQLVKWTQLCRMKSQNYSL